MWDVCTNTSTTGQRKNKQGPRMQAESNGLKECHKLGYTSRFVQQCFSRDLDQTTSLEETVNHGLAEDGHKTRPRRGETPSNTAREKVGSTLRETMIQNITRLLNCFHGFATSWSLLNQRTKRCCVCRDFTAARCDNKATKCTRPGRVSKIARVTLKITQHEIPRKSPRTRAETNRERRHIAIDASNVIVGIPENMIPDSEWSRQNDQSSKL